MPSGMRVAAEARGMVPLCTGSFSRTPLIHAAIPLRMSSAKLCTV